MSLLLNTHTLNLVFLPKSFKGGRSPTFKGQEGACTHRPPADPHLAVYTLG